MSGYDNTGGHRPWTKWFWSDWRGDEKLRLCSLEARGLWAEILALMDKSERYGYLLVDGRPPTAPELARLVGAHWRVVTRAMDELIAHHVPSQDEHGCLYSRRLVREAKRRAIAQENGGKGGNPVLLGLTKGISQGLSQVRAGLDKTQKPEARSQKDMSLATDNPEAAADFIEVYRDVYRCVRYGAVYPPLSPSWKDQQAAMTAASTYARDRWPQLIEVFLRMDPKAINGMNRPGSLPQFLAMAPEADTLLREAGR